MGLSEKKAFFDRPIISKEFSHRLWKAGIKARRLSRKLRITLAGYDNCRRELLENLSLLQEREKLRVRLNCFPDLQEDFSADDDFEVEVVPSDFVRRPPFAQAEPADVFLVKSSGWKESALLLARERKLASICAVWMCDNHHSFEKNFHLATASDVYFPAHGYCAAEYQNKFAIFGGAIPCCCSLWTRKKAIELYDETRAERRSDDLSGGFIEYAGLGERRNRLIRQCLTELPQMALTLDPVVGAEKFAGLDLKTRFLQRRAYKVSLTLPIMNDLGNRVFEALVAGQVPIVPTDVLDLDSVINPELQRQLPIVRLTEYSTPAVKKAHEQALDLFNSGGEDAAEKRHLYAVNNHMDVHRIRKMVSNLRALSK